MKRVRRNSYFLNDFSNFIDIFRKNVTNDIIKCRKKKTSHPLPRKNIFGKTTGEGRIDPTPAFLGLKNVFLVTPLSKRIKK